MSHQFLQLFPILLSFLISSFKFQNVNMCTLKSWEFLNLTVLDHFHRTLNRYVSGLGRHMKKQIYTCNPEKSCLSHRGKKTKKQICVIMCQCERSLRFCYSNSHLPTSPEDSRTIPRSLPLRPKPICKRLSPSHSKLPTV